MLKIRNRKYMVNGKCLASYKKCLAFHIILWVLCIKWESEKGRIVFVHSEMIKFV